ncbi:hypothetical protein [Actinokineospora sp. HUAS TT18]|uniref:hypothetical protein n=1 Tax=Actinokineospora sp. HUAS TT18 TaxID=3447451 RepID=UPI003F521A7A
MTGGVHGATTAVADPNDYPRNSCEFWGWSPEAEVVTYHSDADYEHKAFLNCQLPGPNPTPDYEVTVSYVDQPPVVWCLSNWTTVDIGVLPRHAAARVPGVIEQIGQPRISSGDCGPIQGPTEQPQVEVAGRVVLQYDDANAPNREIKKARYALKGLILDSTDPNATPQWRTIHHGPGNSGPAVEGFLDEDGGFVLDFTYPAVSYPLGGGDVYYGCEWRRPYPRFDQWGACLDGDLVLEVYADNGQGLTVTNPSGQPALLASISLGAFYERPNHTYVVDSDAAHAYRGAYHVVDYTATLPMEQRLTQVDIHLSSNPFESDRYDHATGQISLSNSAVRGSIPEFLTALKYYHQLLGEASPGVPADCRYYLLAEPTSPECALQLGFAAALAEATAEPFPVPDTIEMGFTGYDIEHCALDQPDGPAGPEPCTHEGGSVGLRVAAALKDLTDTTNETADSETGNGFVDFADYPFDLVMSIVAEGQPLDIDQFWDDWRLRLSSGDRAIMFMNTLEYTDLQDEELATNATGDWATLECATCRDRDVVSAAPSTGVDFGLSWNLGRYVTAPGRYDILVRLPAGHPDYNSDVCYVFTTDGHIEPICGVNHVTASDGWLNLRPEGFVGIQPNVESTLRVSAANPPGGAINVDAVIIAPHDDEIPGGVRVPVTATGKIHTFVNSRFEKERLLGGARYELLCECHDGSPSSPLLERPVLDSIGPDGVPVGNEVAGYVLPDGTFEVTFAYPNQVVRSDGTVWTGCELPANPIPFLGSYACEDSSLFLRVYAEDESEDSVVENESGDTGVIADIPLGHFFMRSPEETNYRSQTAEGNAYGAILTVRELVGADLTSSAFIKLEDVEAADYSPITNTIRVPRQSALGTSPEHEMGHLVQERISLFSTSAPDCRDHTFSKVTNRHCAFKEGFANFIAVASEHAYAPSSSSPPLFHQLYNLESCDPESCANRGPDVEGSVAMALWDIYDDTPLEYYNGFFDSEPAHPVGDITAAMREADDLSSFDAFWNTWRRLHPEQEETAFMNAQIYTALSDASVESGNPQGDWRQALCIIDCLNESMMYGVAPASLTWNVGSSIKYEHEYDIWVKILPAAATATVQYRVTTVSGEETVTVDQASSPRWVNLKKEGFRLGHDGGAKVTVSGESGIMMADALVVVPHLQ